MKKIILLALICILSLPSKAQQHDANLYKVIKAMENGILAQLLILPFYTKSIQELKPNGVSMVSYLI